MPTNVVIMEDNVGNKDKIVRILLGAILGTASLAILAGYLDYAEVYSAALGIISLILLATGFLGKCGLYQAIGINTCEAE